MQELNNKLITIQQKLQQVMGMLNSAKADNQRLRAEVEKLHNAMADKELQLKDVQQQADILKSGIQNWHPEQKKLFAKRIDIYLKEINKCLAMLNE